MALPGQYGKAVARFKPDRMRKASDILGYEYGTFQDGAFIAMAARSNGTTAIGNVALESSVLHLRNLLDFFYVKDFKQVSGRILAEHFFTAPADWQSERDRADNLEWGETEEGVRKFLTINQLTQLCNDFAAHLVWERLDTEKPLWHFRSMLLHLDKLMGAFINKAPTALVTLERDGQLELPPTAAGIAASVARYRTEKYKPQVIQVPTSDKR